MSALEPTTFAVLEPGDRVLMLVEDLMSSQDIRARRALLVEAFPDVEFTFLTGVNGVLVQRAQGDTETSAEGAGSSSGGTR